MENDIVLLGWLDSHLKDGGFAAQAEEPRAMRPFRRNRPSTAISRRDSRATVGRLGLENLTHWFMRLFF